MSREQRLKAIESTLTCLGNQAAPEHLIKLYRSSGFYKEAYEMEKELAHQKDAWRYVGLKELVEETNEENNMENEKTEKLNLKIERLNTGYILTENYDHAFFRPERHAFSTKASLKKKIEKLLEELA